MKRVVLRPTMPCALRSALPGLALVCERPLRFPRGVGCWAMNGSALEGRALRALDREPRVASLRFGVRGEPRRRGAPPSKVVIQGGPHWRGELCEPQIANRELRVCGLESEGSRGVAELRPPRRSFKAVRTGGASSASPRSRTASCESAVWNPRGAEAWRSSALQGGDSRRSALEGRALRAPDRKPRVASLRFGVRGEPRRGGAPPSKAVIQGGPRWRGELCEPQIANRELRVCGLESEGSRGVAELRPPRR